MIGPDAIRAIADIERSTDARMRTSTSNYPPAVVRLYLMNRVATLLGMPRPELPGVPDRATLGKAADAADAVVGMALGTLPGVDATLRTLCGFAAEPFAAAGTVATWADKLQRGVEFTGIPSDDTARFVIAGSLRAWWDIANVADAATRETRRRTLARTTLETLGRSAPPGKRSKFVEAQTPERAGAGLADALLDAARTYGTGQGASD
jgi:hypothetical protein